MTTTTTPETKHAIRAAATSDAIRGELARFIMNVLEERCSSRCLDDAADTAAVAEELAASLMLHAFSRLELVGLVGETTQTRITTEEAREVVRMGDDAVRRLHPAVVRGLAQRATDLEQTRMLQEQGFNAWTSLACALELGTVTLDRIETGTKKRAAAHISIDAYELEFHAEGVSFEHALSEAIAEAHGSLSRDVAKMEGVLAKLVPLEVPDASEEEEESES